MPMIRCHRAREDAVTSRRDAVSIVEPEQPGFLLIRMASLGEGGDVVQLSIIARRSVRRALAALRRLASHIIVQTNTPNVTMIHCTGMFARSSRA